MHQDLMEAIEAAKQARDGVLKGEMAVKEANAVAANNHTIVTAHGLDLRERIFIADSARNVLPGARERPGDDETPGAARIETSD